MMRKGKSKSSKLARMNEEERARYMQCRAEVELEAKRRKQQLIAIFTKNKLKREEAYSRLNIAKINEKWRFVLRQIKFREIYDNVNHLCESFGRMVKLKDGIISRLHDELKIADEEHRRLQEIHIILINDTIARYKQKLKDLYDTYKLDSVKSDSLVELRLLQNSMKKISKDIQTSISKRERILSGEESARKTQNAINIHNVLFLEGNVASNLVHRSLVNMENLWEQLNKVLTEYERMTRHKIKQYEYLKGQDNIHQLYVSQYHKVHLQLQNVVESLKHDTQALSSKRESEISKLQTKDIDLKKKIRNVKQQFTAVQTVDLLQLKKLTVTSNDVLLNLRRSMKTGTTILELIAICSALEPFLFNLKKYFVQDTVHESLYSTIPSSCSTIDTFWKQYNHITANNILLKRTHKKLCLENKRLRYKLRGYLVMLSGVPTTCSVVTALI
ncbi:dynein regulatory complex subunit 2 [Hylaeus anthracinus]|uniref:dynein regulatory complex subunit 2 n=1 Tax=Hylaeus anthracinus TaxID=313031 RepID=UPI0023B950FB|nr:dynein regulatory complex subunit 2 [Hylaeus anthracinus]